MREAVLWLALIAADAPRLAAQEVASVARDSARHYDLEAQAVRRSALPGSSEKALALTQRALALYRGAGDAVGEGRMLSRIGALYWDLEDGPLALAHLDSGLTLLRAAGDRANVGRTLLNLGNIHLANQELGPALAAYSEALQAAREVRDTEDEALALFNLGWLFQVRARREFSGELYDSSAGFYRQAAQRAGIADTAMQGLVLYGLGSIHEDRSQLDSALALYAAALLVQDAARARSRVARTLYALGSVYASLGRAEVALRYLRRASATYHDLGDASGQVMADTKIQAVQYGMVGDLLGRGLADSALAVLQRATAEDTAAPAAERAIDLILESDIIREAIRRMPDAEAFLRYVSQPDTAEPSRSSARALLLLARAQNDRRTEADALFALGDRWLEDGAVDSAAVCYDSALALYRGTRDRFGEAKTLYRRGWMRHRTGAGPDLAVAVALYDSASRVRARLAGVAGDDPNRVSLREQDFELYGTWALAWLARAGEVGERRARLAALAAAERGRAQALLTLRNASDTAGGSGLADEGARLMETLAYSEAVWLSYLLAEDTLVIWVARPGSQVLVVRVPVLRASTVQSFDTVPPVLSARGRWMSARDSLSRLVQALRAALESPGGEDVAPRAAAVAAVVMPPEVRAALASARELVVVPFGPLGLVPFAALPLGDDGPLSARYAVRYAPSLSTAAALKHPVASSRSRQSLVLGNPTTGLVLEVVTGGVIVLKRLPGAERTATWLGELLHSPPLVAAAATESAVRSRIGTADLVHFGTHGYSYATAELARESFLALAPDSVNEGVLTAAEILDSLPPLRAELVVMSGCVTALGDVREAEGVVGLARAFLAKGARAVLVSLWDVNDAVTAELEQAFYREWLGVESGAAPGRGEALRRAQESIRGRHPHPYYWAGFQLVGQ
ncbi:MAG: CHAT domain-containing protein [Gemmatimonadetes bacterium]|nr:CHAT domain-containing protein [Gemmatimonadota bacterium]